MTPIGDESSPIEVLLVEDSRGDVRLTQEALRDVNRAINLHVASDGVEAMAFLRREGPHIHAPRPDLVLLDLNLPKMDGRQVLAQIKQDNSLKMIPTIILTTSESEADVTISYQLHANCYLRKPARWDTFDRLVRSINAFWLTKAKLPQQRQADEQEKGSKFPRVLCKTTIGHGGNIAVESQPGHRSAFGFAFAASEWKA